MKSILSLLCLGLLLPINGNNVLSGNKSVVSEQNNDKTLYVDLSLNSKFLESGANPYIHYGEVDVSLVLVSDDIYQTESIILNKVFTLGFEICSFNGTYKTDVIANSLLNKDMYNYVCLASYVDGSNASIEGYGHYGDKIANPGATYKTHRVWLENNINDFYDNNKYTNGVMYYYSNKWNIIVPSDNETVTNPKDGLKYYCFDLPIDVRSLYFLRLSSKEKHNYLLEHSFYVDSIMYGICYSNKNTNLSEVLIQPVPNASAIMLGMVVEAFLTYGKDPSNGAVKSTMQNVYSTWFKNKSATKDELKNVKILDYTGYAANGNSYEGLEKNSYFSVYEKWNTMCSQAGIDSNTGKDASMFNWLSGGNVAIIIVASLTGGAIITFAIILIIKKRKIANS